MTASLDFDDLPARELLGLAEQTLKAFAEAMNEETTLLRAGRFRDATLVSADKVRLAQDYVTYSRAVQRQIDRLKAEAPDDIAMLRMGHERLATQMAENLKVIATSREVTEDLLGDVARQMGRGERPKTYGAGGEVAPPPTASGGIVVNRAL